MQRANYDILVSETDGKKITIRDVGPWDEHPTITNDAELVVVDLADILHGRRLFYYDSDGELSELVVNYGKRGAKFTGFAPVQREETGHAKSTSQAS